MSESNPVETVKYTNHLINESSPYLLAHAHNPVNWYPWSKEALEKAKREDKPIFLSIGYAACHWCHVMEEESFADGEVAGILNENYVAIKVDREQRPDLDQIYMSATMAMTGSGGWPMSIFLTADLRPFFAGTYFPPDDRNGRPGFKYILTELAKGYKAERTHIEEMASRIVEALQSSHSSSDEKALLGKKNIESAVRALMNDYDPVLGGFGHAPKFPHPVKLAFMLRQYAASRDSFLLTAAEKTLQAMARGGIYDQLGGGFHRYSTDGRWLVPHFEKMLYDNALLASTYGDAYLITGKEMYRQVASETLDFILREMTGPSGAFYSSLDADSEGEEGKFYLWKKGEIDSILGDKAALFCKYYNITADGNFEGKTNILNLDSASEQYRERTGLALEEFSKIIDTSRQILFDIRARRIRPATDDKILTSWNGLAISALAKGYRITGDEQYRAAALKAAQFIRSNLYHDSLLVHSCRQMINSPGTFLEDYAYLISALCDLYEITYDFGLIEFASELATTAVPLFTDQAGNFYLSPENQAEYFIRPKDIADGALPAPGSIMIQAFLRLAAITGNENFRKQAEKGLAALSSGIAAMPQAMISAVAALDYFLSDGIEIVVVGHDGREDFMKEIYRHYIPHRVIVVSARGDEPLPLLKGRRSGGPVTAYICRNFACLRPVTTLEELKKEMDLLSEQIS
ncbi:MAG: thioredoxin domain-containing protein [candidate division Zixibacteria bacterium]|nr:thioredoxin domain-containing protein [candidate division Zixibacteria bacterium]